MPVYEITKFTNVGLSVFKIEYKNKKIVLIEAINEESKNIDVNKLTYQQILELIEKIKNTFKYKVRGKTIDDYFYKVPYWTEGRE